MDGKAQLEQALQEERVRHKYALEYARGLDNDELAALIGALSELLDERRFGPNPEELITMVEAARLAGLSHKTLDTQRRRGKLECVKRGRDWYLKRGELGRYLTDRDLKRGSHARMLAIEDVGEPFPSLVEAYRAGKDEA